MVPRGKTAPVPRPLVNAVTDLFLGAVKAKRSLSHPLLDDGILPDETDTRGLFFE